MLLYISDNFKCHCFAWYRISNAKPLLICILSKPETNFFFFSLTPKDVLISCLLARNKRKAARKCRTIYYNSETLLHSNKPTSTRHIACHIDPSIFRNCYRTFSFLPIINILIRPRQTPFVLLTTSKNTYYILNKLKTRLCVQGILINYKFRI